MGAPMGVPKNWFELDLLSAIFDAIFDPVLTDSKNNVGRSMTKNNSNPAYSKVYLKYDHTKQNNLLNNFKILTEMRLFRGYLLVESRAGARVMFMSLRMRKLKKHYANDSAD